MSHLQKLPFDAMPGLPPRDDAEVTALMETLARLPHRSTEELARCLLRAALGQERTSGVAYLTRLAEDTLSTVRLRRYLTPENAAEEAESHLIGRTQSVEHLEG
jgi:hypothetical protein